MAPSTTLSPTPATTDSSKPLKKAASEMKNPTTPLQASFGCKHIKELLNTNRDRATQQYTLLLHCIRRHDNISSKIYKSGSVTDIRVEPTYLCIQCSNVSKTKDRHRHNHAFSVESNEGFIFCHDCKDFVYDPTFEEIRAGNSRKRKHVELTEDEEKLISTNSTSVACSTTGLRGLYNMGQTCFMSVILQSLIHNPFIREWYLSEGHVKEHCEREACTSCALDDIFTEFFSQEKREGYGAVHMLQGCWRGGGSLAGYSQQDAHEFLGFIRDSLHTAITEEDEEFSSNKRAKHCQCIIHLTFAGLLKSTVICSSCKNTTTNLDPFMDLSLDIRNTPVLKKKKLGLINGTSTVKELPPMDLTECLDRFTSTETLSAEAGNYTCRNCSSAQEIKKKLSLSRLPHVVAIHLKRFSHSTKSKESSKIDTKIRFPTTLDLSPYTTGSAFKSKFGLATSTPTKNGSAKDPTCQRRDSDDEPAVARLPDPVYELSSVVVHKGKIDNGHYISYCRQQDEWFRFDDSMVVQVRESEVLAAEAYMLFYVVKEI